MSEGLKPCPFCGEEHICLFGVQDEDGHAFAVGCVTGDCPGHVATSWRYSTREKAIEAWNKRAADPFNGEVMLMGDRVYLAGQGHFVREENNG